MSRGSSLRIGSIEHDSNTCHHSKTVERLQIGMFELPLLKQTEKPQIEIFEARPSKKHSTEAKLSVNKSPLTFARTINARSRNTALDSNG